MGLLSGPGGGGLGGVGRVGNAGAGSVRINWRYMAVARRVWWYYEGMLLTDDIPSELLPQWRRATRLRRIRWLRSEWAAQSAKDLQPGFSWSKRFTC